MFVCFEREEILFCRSGGLQTSDPLPPSAGIMGGYHHNQLPKILLIYGWSDPGDRKIHPKGGLAMLGTGLAHCAVIDLPNPPVAFVKADGERPAREA